MLAQKFLSTIWGRCLKQKCFESGPPPKTFLILLCQPDDIIFTVVSKNIRVAQKSLRQLAGTWSKNASSPFPPPPPKLLFNYSLRRVTVHHSAY